MRNSLNRVKLLTVVDYEITDMIVNCVCYFGVGFVVAVKKHSVCRESRADRGIKLSAGNHIRADSLVGCDSVHLLTAESLARIKRK